MVVLPDQKYPVEGGSLSFDFFRPDGDGPFPLVVFIHGGGWISGDRTMFRDEAIWLAPQGFACACIDYRLAPLYPFPVPVADCQNFVTFIRGKSEELKIDPNRITAMGNSAGGHLALMLGLCPNRFDSFDGPFERVSSVVDICGIADMSDPSQVHFPIATTFLEQFMDGGFVGREDIWKSASPLSYLDQAQGRFLVIHGSNDDVVPTSQSERLAEELVSRDVQCRLVVLPGEAHSFTLDGWGHIRKEYVTFLSSTE